MKKILSICVKKEIDDFPDTSYMGKFVRDKQKWCIDRKITGDWEGSGHLRYFLPANPPVGETRKERAEEWKYCIRDHERMEQLNKGLWCFLYIIADTTIDVNGIIQHITSGGIGGVESDCDDYIDTLMAEELDSLYSQLYELGFTDEEINSIEVDYD